MVSSFFRCSKCCSLPQGFFTLLTCRITAPPRKWSLTKFGRFRNSLANFCCSVSFALVWQQLNQFAKRVSSLNPISSARRRWNVFVSDLGMLVYSSVHNTRVITLSVILSLTHRVEELLACCKRIRIKINLKHKEMQYASQNSTFQIHVCRFIRLLCVRLFNL